MIKSVSQTPVHTLLSPENNIVYEIPVYQREYSWGKEQWDALFDDLLEEGTETGHFLGTIICVNKTNDSTARTVLELVDGQQRMTTLSLFLLALFVELKARESGLDDDQKSDLTTLRRMLSLKGQSEQRLRLQKQNSNALDYAWLLSSAGFDVEASKTSNLGNRRISRAFTHFRKRIGEFLLGESDREVDALLDLFAMVKIAVLVKIEVETHSDAFRLFESLNNRGVQLTPIDLIKTALLSTADKQADMNVDRAYKAWSEWLELLGGEYGTQERFFRQFYNAFKSDWDLAVPGVAIATKSKLMRVYEELLDGDLKTFVERMTLATRSYSRILRTQVDDSAPSKFDEQVQDLTYSQGAPSFMLLLFVLVHQSRFKISESDLVEITRALMTFSIRRNITNTPPTYDLDRVFISIIEKLPKAEIPAVELIRMELMQVSASDDVFMEQLKGQIYDENRDAARFILIKLAQVAMTRESRMDLWERRKSGSKDVYVWTIEHILPQGANLPSAWSEMLGGEGPAMETQRDYVHTLGNLTITAYNATLGNKSFVEKRDRVDDEGRPVGYRNGLVLNAHLETKESWTASDIQERTDKLAAQVVDLFSF